jgi:hypothetical protein
MAIQETRTLPAPFVDKLGTDLANQITAQAQIPVVAPGKEGIAQLTGESAEDFAKRQQAAQQFDIRQQSLAGLAPQVAGLSGLEAAARGLAQEGIGSFQPFVDAAKSQAQTAGGILGDAGTGLDRAGVDLSFSQAVLGSTPLGAATSQEIQQFMSPYQSQVIDATLSEFDRNTAIREQQIRDQQTALGALGSGRAGVQLAEFGTGAARERALLQANLLQQGFGQAQAARQQDIANRFGLGQALAGTAGQRAGFAGQRAGLAGAQLGQAQFQTGLASLVPGLQRADVGQLGALGAIDRSLSQAQLDADRQAATQAAFMPQQQLDRYAAQVTGLMGGYPGGTRQEFVPQPSPLQSALGIATTLGGLYLGSR